MIVDPKDREDLRVLVRSTIGLVVLHALVSREQNFQRDMVSQVDLSLSLADEFISQSNLSTLL